MDLVRTLRRALPTATAVLLALSAHSAADAVPCVVPGTHPTIQVAVDEPSCDPIELPEADYAESLSIARPVSILGTAVGGVSLRGRIEVSQGAAVGLQDLTIETPGPEPALRATEGATVATLRVWARQQAALFADGFESGDLSPWAAP